MRRLALVMVLTQLLVVALAVIHVVRKPAPAEVAGKTVCRQVVANPFHQVSLDAAFKARLTGELRAMSASTRWHAVVGDLRPMLDYVPHEERGPLTVWTAPSHRLVSDCRNAL